MYNNSDNDNILSILLTCSWTVPDNLVMVNFFGIFTRTRPRTNEPTPTLRFPLSTLQAVVNSRATGVVDTRGPASLYGTGGG